ncbi:MAG: transposase [Desulfovibrio sp.]|nr:transposase [Desulfovibrio sp.]
MESTPNGKNVQGGVSIPFQEILNLNQEELRAYIDKMILQAVESVLNDMIEAEADEQCCAGRYERNAERRSTRAGHYDRQFTTKAGTVTIHMPKLRDLRFSTAVFERWWRREASLEEAFVEMYLAGDSTRRVSDVVEAFMGGGASAHLRSAVLTRRRTPGWKNGAPVLCRGATRTFISTAYGAGRCSGTASSRVSVLVAVGMNGEGRRETHPIVFFGMLLLMTPIQRAKKMA